MKHDKLKLYQTLNYVFRDEMLLEAALTHRSIQGSNNERLEFLGDSIINFIIAEELYQRYPNAKEGELSRLRSSLVKGQTLADLAHEFQLGDFLHLGVGELKSGGHRRESILADAFEALTAAIYLDSDMPTCKDCLIRWFQSRLQAISIQELPKDPKSELQEYLQARKIAVPHYEVVEIEGKAHAQTFYVQCHVPELQCTVQASGSSRRKGEQAAAEKALHALKMQNEKTA